MMQNLSMHVLDIASNSVRAEATDLHIIMINSTCKDLISIEVIDNGKGMDEEMIQRVQDPFFTSRTTRRIGLGIPFFKELAEACNGSFELESQVNVGTRIYVSMQKSHWDTPPLGDLGDAIVLVWCQKETNHIHFDYKTDANQFSFDSDEIKAILGDEVSVCEAEIMMWCKDYINQQIQVCEEEQV